MDVRGGEAAELNPRMSAVFASFSCLALVAPTYGSAANWFPGPKMRESRFGHGMGEIGGKLFVVGGVSGSLTDPEEMRELRSLEIFHTETGHWSVGPNMTALSGFIHVGVIGEVLFVVSSTKGKPLESYNSATSMWSVGPNMKCGGALGAYGSKLFFVGCGAFDTVHHVWSDMARSESRYPYLLSIVSVSHNLYLLLCSDQSDGILQVYDAKSNTMGVNYSLPNKYCDSDPGVDAAMSASRRRRLQIMVLGHWPMSTVMGTNIFFVGGCRPFMGGERGVDIFDILNGTWAVGTKLPWPLCLPAVAAIDSRLYVAGGTVDKLWTEAATWIFCAADDCYTEPPPTLTPVNSTVLVSVLRVQAGSWAENIGNADVADVAGLSCFLENFPPDQVPGFQPAVVANYTIEVFAPQGYDRYPNCPDVDPITGKAVAVRTCVPADVIRVGRAPQCSPHAMPCKCQYPGYWYGLPAAGECKHGQLPGKNCWWRVLSFESMVRLECLRRNGCGSNSNGGGCPPNALLRAFSLCKNSNDTCTPQCRSCQAAAPGYNLCNDLGRITFDPAACTTCLSQHHTGLGWYLEKSTGMWACDRYGSTANQPVIFINSSSADAARSCRCAYNSTHLPPPPPTCPGGSMTRCIDLCPLSPPAAYKACTGRCAQVCPHRSLFGPAQ